MPRYIKHAILHRAHVGKVGDIKSELRKCYPGKYPDRRFGTISARMLIARDLFSQRNRGGGFRRAKVNTDNSWRSMIKARARPRL